MKMTSKDEIHSHLQDRCMKMKHIKWYIDVHLQMNRQMDKKHDTAKQHFSQ